MKKLPLLIDDYLDKAILESKEMVNIIISKYGISHDDIPDKCILSFKYTGLERIVKTRYKPIKKIPDIGGGAPLYILKVGNRRYCYSNLCIGGPCSVFLLETLYGLGIDEVVYIFYSINPYIYYIHSFSITKDFILRCIQSMKIITDKTKTIAGVISISL